MDRRNFLRMGSLAVLGSLAAPSLALPDTVRGVWEARITNLL